MLGRPLVDAYLVEALGGAENLHPPVDGLEEAPQDRQLVHPGGVGNLAAVSKVDHVGFQGSVHGGVGDVHLPAPSLSASHRWESLSFFR